MNRHRLLIAAIAACAAAIGGWVVFYVVSGPTGATFDVDLTVYRDGGLIVRGVRPYYDPHAGTPLYDWGGYSALALKFTYTPFAAIAFAVASFIPLNQLLAVSIVVNMASLIATMWFTFGGLGYTGRDNSKKRLIATLFAVAVTFWLQPDIRTIYLGQVNLILMAGIMWDLCQPGEGRWWRGFATGIAAGIKLTPLIFVPYLLITRRVREAAVTVAGFLFTIAVGFAVLPGDSAAWWLHGLFIRDGTRAGFIGWAGNQSMRALITRLAGSVDGGQVPWLAASVIALAVGMASAYWFDRAGHRVVAILVTALTGLLISPISWDHHWVWIAPGVAVAGHYALKKITDNSNKRRGRAVVSGVVVNGTAGGLAALAAGMIVVFGPWPDAWWETERNLGKFSLGFLWAPPNTNPEQYALHGDQPWFAEYHWHGLQLITGNAYILGGLALMIVLAVTAWRLRRGPASSPTAIQETTAPHIVAG